MAHPQLTPLPPNVVSLNLLLCERVLQEKDGINTPIRLVDVFYVPELVPEYASLPERFHPVVEIAILSIIKGFPDHSKHSLRLSLVRPSGEEKPLVKAPEFDFAPKSEFGDAPTGINIVVGLNLRPKELGTHYVYAYLDDALVGRVAFTLMRRTVETAS